MLEINKNGRDFKAAISCTCQRCGLMVDGFELEYDSESAERGSWAFVKVWMYREAGWDAGSWAGFWARIKMAWDIIRRKRWYVDDMCLDKEGVNELRTACDLALKNWPEKGEVRPTLEELYSKIREENNV